MTTPAPPRYLSAAASHQGPVRGNNEDRVHADDARGIYLVIDGMGGHAAGERAADIALEVVRTRLERQTDDAPQRIREAITLANNAIFQAASTHAEWAGMACVLTVLVVEGARATVGHVGDSRLYRIQGGRIEKITRDHSPVGEREDRGELSEAEAMRHPRRNEVFRDVGSQPRTPQEEGFIDIHSATFDPRGAFLLCSDGLSDALPAAAILEIVERHADDRRMVVRKLLEAATERGKDNVSAVLVQGERFADGAGGKARTSAAQPSRRSVSVALAAACVLGGVILGAALALSAAALLNWLHRGPLVLSVAAPATIASVLDRAQPGDTVQLAPGTYAGDIALKSGVVLLGTDAARCIVHGMISARGVHQVKVANLTVQGAGFDLQDSDVDVERCTVTGARDAGVRYTGASRGLLAASEIRDNVGPGILVSGSSRPELRNNIIAGNGRSPLAPRPGLLITAGAHPWVAGNTFSANAAEPVWLPAGREGLLQKNFFLSAPSKSPPRLYRITPEALP